MNLPTRLLLGGFTTAVVAAGSFGVAGAAPVSSSSAAFTGTVRAHGATGTHLRALAKINGTKADAAAVAAIPGNAGTAELIHDHGYVVYRTIVTASNGTKTEVIVDAGNGTVLAHYRPVWNGVIGS